MTVLEQPVTEQRLQVDIDAERAVVGCVLISDRVVETLRVDEGLRHDRFWDRRCRLVWRAIERLHDRGERIDPLTLRGELADHNQLNDAGGAGHLETLAATPPNVSSARSYARRVVAAWRFRIADECLVEARAAAAARNEEALHAALARAAGTTARETADPSPAAVARRFADRLADTPAQPLPSPWPSLTRRRFHMRPGQTTVLASWSSWAKSWVALELASHVGRHGEPAVIWTNEMSEDELVARQIQRETGVPSDALLNGERPDGQADRIATALRMLPFGVVECFGWPADELARHLRHLKPALAVIDHFHQLPMIGKHEHAEDAVQRLTSAARQSGTHLLLVSQLNTARDTHAEKPVPTMRDLRSTGALQSLPNNVVFLQREQEHDKESGQTWLSPRGVLHVAKQRGGPNNLYQEVWLPPDRMTVREAA